MPLWLYGNTAADLGPQELAWSGFYQNAAERDRAAAMDAARINAQLTQQQQQADEAAAQQDFANRYSLARYATETDASRFNRNLAAREMALRERQFGPGEQDYRDLTSLAGNLTPEQVATFGRNLSPLRRTALTAYATEATAQRNAPEKFATFSAPDVAEAGKNLTDSQKEYTDAATAFTTQRAQLASTLPANVTFDPRRLEFVPNPRAFVPPTPEETALVKDANEKLATLKASLDESLSNLRFHTQTFADLRKEALQRGLTVGIQGGRGVIFNPTSGRTYTTPAPTPPPAPVMQSVENPNWRNLPAFRMTPMVGEAPALDLGAYAPTPTATATLPPPQAPAKYQGRAGRFIVTED